MRRRRALRSEVFAGLDESASEKLLPEPIDRDAGDERVVLLDQPARQPEPVDGLIVAQRMQRAGVAAKTRSPLASKLPRTRSSKDGRSNDGRSFMTSVDGIWRSASAFRRGGKRVARGLQQRRRRRERRAASSSACAPVALGRRQRPARAAVVARGRRPRRIRPDRSPTRESGRCPVQSCRRMIDADGDPGSSGKPNGAAAASTAWRGSR